MPRSKKEYARIRTETQGKILDTAIAIFSKKGFSGTSINDIAEAANISGGLIYRYFKSKQDLFDKIIDTAVGGINEMTEMLIKSDCPQKALKAFAKEMVDMMQDESFMKLNLMIMQGLVSQEHFAFSKIISADEKMLDAVCSLIKKGQEQGIFVAGDVGSKAHLFVATVQGMAIMKSAFRDKHIPPTVNDIMAFITKK